MPVSMSMFDSGVETVDGWESEGSEDWIRGDGIVGTELVRVGIWRVTGDARSPRSSSRANPENSSRIAVSKFPAAWSLLIVSPINPG